MTKRLAILLLAVMFMGLQWRLWVAEDGLANRQRLREAATAAAAENQQLAVRNAELDAEVQDLKSGKAAIEARARTSLGMIKPEETFYLVVR